VVVVLGQHSVLMVQVQLQILAVEVAALVDL
jgi:hypothetical protein